ncbi:MAG TPA: Crp/Fnr family transcriptional regulator [Lentimicrobium sp.]|jgi:CRP/FNR family transcriptional regulator|nr:Crp/Fnr family transcriptional regulator [Lentimicrobium sp.]
MKTYLIPEDCSLDNLEAPCFRSLLPEELNLVSASKTRVIFHKGENLTKQGTFASSVLFIIEGFCKQYVEGEAGKNLNLQLLKSGDFIGLSVAFNKNRYDYSVVALTQTTACLIEKEAISNLVKLNGSFGYNIIKRYCEQNSRLYSSISDLMNKQMNGRLAGALLYISNENPGGDIFQYLSRKDIADFAGLSVESTVKLLKSFERDNLLKLDEKNIILLDIPALEQINQHG